MSDSKLKQAQKLELGLSGEARAADFLEKKNFQIWETRYRVGRDEIDLIAFDPQHQEIVFVEVKTRASDVLLDPEEALDQRKLKAITRAANHYLAHHSQSFDYRFDLITVLPQAIRHLENVTWP
jgi:putative endonuclease